jgi:putative FmdB family regulatory protein
MPRFDFECKKCHEVYEEFSAFDKTGKYKNVKCPNCKSSSKDKLMSVVNSSFNQPEGTDKWHNSQDIRYYKGALPKAKEVRQNAAKESLAGPNPYRSIDDISSGEHFGPVK